MFSGAHNWTLNGLIIWVLSLLALALLLMGLGMVWRLVQQGRRHSVLDRAMAKRAGQVPASKAPAQARVRAAAAAAESLGNKLREGRFGEALLAKDDMVLLDACGYEDLNRAAAWFTLTRTVLCVSLAVIGWFWMSNLSLGRFHDIRWFVGTFLGFALGWMLPKWMLTRRVKQRKREVSEELPLFVDLLRLLQGVGLSMDQSLHVVVSDFPSVMPVLCRDLRRATDQYARGRTREQSLRRLATLYDNDDLDAICRLIVQVDQHGGAVQEPLTRFVNRIHDRRRLALKEKIGVLTVKMTGVMILTLLPALLIVTAGAGFIAVFRGLSKVAGGH